MTSREAAHINHARRPPTQTEFGSAFFIPFPGLCTILPTPTKWYKSAPDHALSLSYFRSFVYCPFLLVRFILALGKGCCFFNV